MFLLQNMGIIYNTLFYAESGGRQASNYLTKGENSPAKNRVISAIDVTKSSNLTYAVRNSGGEIKTLSNAPYEGYKVLDYDRGNYRLLVEGPEGIMISLNLESAIDLLMNVNINGGVLQGKYCMSRKGGEITLVGEDSEVYRNSIKLGDANKPVTLSGGSDTRLVPGSVLIDHNGHIVVYLGKYEYLDTRSSGRSNYIIQRTPRGMMFLYHTAVGTVTTTQSIGDYSSTIIENYSAMGTEEAFMMALYNAKDFIPYIGEPEVYIEAQPTNSQHMLWPPTSRATYPSLVSVYPLNGGKDGFEVTSRGSLIAEENKPLNYLVLRTGGLKRII